MGEEDEEGRKGGRQCEYSICICALNLIELRFINIKLLSQNK